MSAKLQSAVSILRAALDGFLKDDVMTLGASLAYYAMFSISPLLIISIALAGAIFDAEASRGEIFRAKVNWYNGHDIGWNRADFRRLRRIWAVAIFPQSYLEGSSETRPQLV